MQRDKKFFFTAGEYSSYSVITHAQALQDADLMAVLQEYLQRYPEQKQEYHFYNHDFIEFLCAQKIVEKFEITEVHLDCYGHPPTSFLPDE